MGYWPIVRRVIEDSNIILFVLDVRMPELSLNKTLERMVSLHDKILLKVFNKIDLVSDRYLDSVRKRYPEAFFVSGTKNLGISRLRKEMFIIVKRLSINEPIIGVVGYPNVGKSAIINALAHRARAKVSAHAGTTKGIQWIRAGGLFILDSPGVVPFEDGEIKLGVLGSKDPEKLSNIEKVALKIIDMFMEYDKKILGNLYNIETSKENVLAEIAEKKGFLLKGGVADEHRAALFVVKDWLKGRLKF